MLQRVKHLRPGLHREALDGDARDELVAELRGVAGPELPAAEHGIEVGPGRRDVQLDRLARKREVQVVDQLVAQVFAAVAIGGEVGPHPFEPHRVADRVLEVDQGLLEGLKDAIGRALPLGRVVVVDQVRHLALAAHRRRVLDEQHIPALEVHPLPHELPAAFLVDEARHRIGEVRQLRWRIGGGRRADRLRPGGPAIPEAGQGRVDPARQPASLAVRAALDVRPLKVPPGQERPILALHDAVLEQRGPVQQVGDAGRPVSEVLERQHRSEHPE